MTKAASPIPREAPASERAAPRTEAFDELEAALLRALDSERAARAQAEAAEERLAFLYQAASTLFSAPLDRALRLERLAQLAVPSLADWCVVEIVDELGERERVAVNHWNPQRREKCRALLGRVGPVDERAAAGFDKVARTGQPEIVAELGARHPIGRAEADHWALMRDLGVRSYIIAPLKNAGGTFGCVLFAFAESNRRYDERDLALADDLAQRAAMAVENARLFQEAERAIRARDELVSIASHDLRTPLTAVGLRASLLLSKIAKGEASGDQVAAALESTKRQVDLAVALLDDLLNATRIASGKLDLRLEQVDLAALASDALARSHELLVAAGCEATLRTGGAPAVGRWDRLRVEQVITNLLSNAIKYGRGKPIELRVDCDGVMARLEVQDRGIGIPLDQQGTVFDRFSRATDARRGDSHGLGLWITKKIVTALGGRVGVASRPRFGATFTVELPLAGPPSDAPPSGGAPSGSDPAPGCSGAPSSSDPAPA